VSLKLFGSTFALIFLAELPDKTLVTTLVLATGSHPVAVFLGAAAAFLIQSLVAVMFGSVFGYLPASWVHVGAGLLFIGFAVVMWLKRETGEKAMPSPGGAAFARTFATTFLAIFVAEWGDLTQLATVALTAKSRAPVTIFWAATTALWAVTAVGVFVGHHAKRWIRPQLLQRVAAVAFLIGGMILILRR
jgi:putative Ca2+/H+ antiporter (TMEM165/GDT1 family)